MKKFLFILVLAPLIILSAARPALAQTPPCTPSANGYCLLAPLPLNGAGSPVQNSVDINTYIRAAITLIIGLAGGLAVILIMVGGIEYITSATGMGKSNGKDKIYNAIIGLLLVIGAYAILYTINPNLLKFNLNLSTSSDTSVTSSGNGSSGTF
jgi:hypothetical protein